MSSRSPLVEQYMTPCPYTLRRDQPVAQARAMMAEHGIRHLPVLDAGALVGVVSERDLRLFAPLPASELAEIEVGEVMTLNPFSVAPDVPLTAVIAEMVTHKYGCALVVRYGRVVGIFTTTDALEVLWSLLRKTHEHHPELLGYFLNGPADARVVGR